jgi:hypothetical protein
MAQVPIGDGDYQTPELAFRITAVHKDHKPSERAPWHTAGGEWTFADAQLEGEPTASFTFGSKFKANPDSPFAFGDFVLAFPDAEQGKTFIARFAKVFNTKVPAPKGGPLHLAMRSAILGNGMARQPSGGFSGKGSWIATKLFPESDGTQGEVFFNYDLETKRGELSEKDSDYNQDVTTVFAGMI